MDYNMEITPLSILTLYVFAALIWKGTVKNQAFFLLGVAILILAMLFGLISFLSDNVKALNIIEQILLFIDFIVLFISGYGSPNDLVVGMRSAASSFAPQPQSGYGQSVPPPTYAAPTDPSQVPPTNP